MENFSFTSIINLPLEQIDLYKWLVNISENDYKSFSKAHRAVGITTIDGLESMVNVESIGGNLLVHHYKIQQKSNNKLILFSKKSDVYLFHLIKVYVGVEWEMVVKLNDAKTTLFICEIRLIYPNKLLKIASMLVGGNYFLQKHIDEEGPLFAKNIETKFST